MRPPLSTNPFSTDRPRAKRPPKRAAPHKGESAELAGYISDMTAELAKLAGDAQMPMLCYFLNLARVEADFHVRGMPAPRPKT